MKIILGSQSKKRREILSEMGYEFDVMPSDFDELSVRSPVAWELPLLLARAKADTLLQKVTKPALLITSDTVVECNGNIIEKARDAEEVKHFYREYGKHPAEIITAVVVTNTAGCLPYSR